MLPRNPLARHLLVLIVLKIGLIAVIYQVFFAEQQVDPSADSVATHLLAAPAHSSPSPRSPAHAD